MSLKDELLSERTGVVTKELDGRSFRFREPKVDAQQRVMAAGGVTTLPSQRRKGQREPVRHMNLGAMRAQALIETLLEDEGDALAFNQSHLDQILAAPLNSKVARLAELALELFNTDDDEGDAGNG